MRKFLPFVFCGVAALSYSQLGAAADADPGQKPGADQSGNPGATAGDSSVTRDQSGVYRNKDDKRAAKRGSEESSSAGSSNAGSSSGKGNDSKAMEKDDSTSAAPSSTRTPGSTPKGTGY
jgi:hypothetical protein